MVEAASWSVLLPVLREAAEQRRFHHHVSMNANKLARCKEDPQMRAIVASAHSLGADGVVVRVGAWWRNDPIPARITGCDLGWRLLEEAAGRGWRVALVGATPAVVGRVGAMVEERGVHVVHLEDGYEPDESAVIDRLRRAEPQLVLAALGTPKAERMLHAAQLPAVCLGVGGAFDVWAGLVPRASVGLQQVGLEGVIRVLREPRKRLGPLVRSVSTLVGS